MSDLPTETEKQHTKWSLLLADLEYRMKQARLADADFDLRLQQSRLADADLDLRLQQLRQAQQDVYWKPWQVVVAVVTAAAALMGAGGLVGGLVVRLILSQ